MLFCENCGNKISDAPKFCPNCGESLIKEYDSQKLSQPTEQHSNRNSKVKDDAIKREKLIKLLLKKYVNEYLYILIISSLVSVASYGYYLITLSESAIGWAVFGGLFVVISLPVLMFRLQKRNNLIKALSTNVNPNSEIWAGHEGNTFILHVLSKSYEIPKVMLPYSLDKCLEIINSKTT